MKPLSLGELRIDTVVENEAFVLRFDELLPTADPAALAEERDWLEPRFGNLARGHALLSFHSYLVRTPRHTILVDTCVGNDKDRGGVPGFHHLRTGWLDNLRAAGVDPAAVDYVMCTHMHPDHIGWNTRLVDGRWVPTFPNARYVFARTEYEHRRRAWEGGEDPRMRAFSDSVLPVLETGQALIVASDHELDEHIALEAAAGHTPGNVVINLRSRGAHAVMSGDVLHHPVQVRHPEWSAGFCEDPALSATFRRSFVERHADSDTIILPAHFPAPTAGRIRTDNARWRYHFID
jgi:glyoxylase-like metal-dependent hydrolase (beta-lactamase superfamily II)